MADPNFTTLEGIYNMFSPSDLVGSVQPNLGNELQGGPGALLALLANNGRGVLSIADLISALQSYQSPAGSQGGPSVDLSQYLTIWTPTNFPNLGANSSTAQMAMGPTGNPITVGSLKEVIGADYEFPEDASVVPPNVSIIMSNAAFISPMTRNTRAAEIFLNSMPPTVLASLVPYMQIEFEFTRDPSDKLQTLSTLKLLMGAADKTTMSPANKAIIEGSQVSSQGSPEVDFVGMEVFTSPITLTNPTPNGDVGTGGSRYTDVLDPYRPFASLEHVNINSKPSGAGFVCYKMASMTLKVHDRSRLVEISDLLRPQSYSGVTCWMTYGWRAPTRGDQNPYFSYVNDHLLVREPYGVKNSHFSFDTLGQATINLELFTKGVSEFRDLKVTDNSNDLSFQTGQVKKLIEDISRYRQRLKLDPPSGVNKEIRAFQILDSAEVGEFPAGLGAQDVAANIKSLKKALAQTSGIDQAAVTGLISSMQQLYTPAGNGSSKFSFKERYETRVTNTLKAMFNEVTTGPDPFIPTAAKGFNDEITKICDDLNKPPATKAASFRKKAVSFGKIFSVFTMRSLLSIPQAVDEVQVFFYKLNDQCGPISNHNVAEFPIDIAQFIDQFHQLVEERGGEKISMEDFLALAVDGQFLDNRAIGYGLRSYYEPYASGQDPKLKVGNNNEQNFESKMAAYTAKYGGFTQPTVEMYVEMSHQKVPDAGQNDILQAINYSAKDASTVSVQDAQGNATRKIMRIHFYDKQATPYKAAAQLLRNENNTGYLNTNQDLDVYAKSVEGTSATALANVALATGATITDDQLKGLQLTQLTPFGGNQQIKDTVSKMVPSIRFGCNGSTVTAANLASKAEPLLATKNILATTSRRNTAQPNGSGDLGVPLRVIPAQLTMNSWGNPLATAAQQYFIDFQTGTTLDNLYILVSYAHAFSPGKFETTWTFGYWDAYAVFEGAPNIVQQLGAISPNGNGTT